MCEHSLLVGVEVLGPESLEENLEGPNLRIHGRREMRYRWTTGMSCQKNRETEVGSAVSTTLSGTPGGPVKAAMVWWTQGLDDSRARSREVGKWRQGE